MADRAFQEASCPTEDDIKTLRRGHKTECYEMRPPANIYPRLDFEGPSPLDGSLMMHQQDVGRRFISLCSKARSLHVDCTEMDAISRELLDINRQLALNVSDLPKEKNNILPSRCLLKKSMKRLIVPLTCSLFLFAFICVLAYFFHLKLDVIHRSLSDVDDVDVGMTPFGVFEVSTSFEVPNTESPALEEFRALNDGLKSLNATHLRTKERLDRFNVTFRDKQAFIQGIVDNIQILKEDVRILNQTVASTDQTVGDLDLILKSHNLSMQEINRTIKTLSEFVTLLNQSTAVRTEEFNVLFHSNNHSLHEMRATLKTITKYVAILNQTVSERENEIDVFNGTLRDNQISIHQIKENIRALRDDMSERQRTDLDKGQSIQSINATLRELQASVHSGNMSISRHLGEQHMQNLDKEKRIAQLETILKILLREESLNIEPGDPVYPVNKTLTDVVNILSIQLYKSLDDRSKITVVFPVIALDDSSNYDGRPSTHFEIKVINDEMFDCWFYQKNQIDGRKFWFDIGKPTNVRPTDWPIADRAFLCVMDSIDRRVLFYQILKGRIRYSGAEDEDLYFGDYFISNDKLRELKIKSGSKSLKTAFILYKTP